MEKKYNPEIHKRKSIRIPDFDYSQAGLYFLTICTHEKAFLFGEIVGVEKLEPEMCLNDAGKYMNECWQKIPTYFPKVILHAHTIMPNHVHGIIELTDFRPETKRVESVQSLTDQAHQSRTEFQHRHQFQKIIQSSIGSIVRGFKTGVTKWFRINNPDEFPLQHPLWQRNYYEHIIRSPKSYHTISTYIEGNPAKWHEDKFYVPGVIS